MKSFKKLYKTLNESISCNVPDFFTRRALGGKFGTQRALGGHLGNRALEENLGTQALGHSKHSRHFI